ncbi:hypothetical protein SAMN05443144_11424 [Fodinibius roseus]|uniref:Uncharacterized protein n=1 Tax=Fodinibius roseus TaxID=1194090 RepID=A0A1M5F0J8_9BACT|nr:hypothetical protein [Fodinibius roseus]SHF84966.1 hypothetical protein SAMN05443144_11424 [Fodinibius roseus]
MRFSESYIVEAYSMKNDASGPSRAVRVEKSGSGTQYLPALP